MWNWKPQRSEEPRLPRNSATKELFPPCKKPLDHPENYGAFDVRKHYIKIKENHPFYGELRRPHQQVVKLSYLEKMQNKFQE